MLKKILPFLPKENTDLPAFFFMNFGFISITYFELFHVLPTVDENSKFSFITHFFLGLFFLINIYGNYYKVIVTDTSTKGMMMPTLLKPGWRYCYTCECNSPPRSWHCSYCNGCILRRDHHCSFAGVCVGHKNLRYFLSLLFWLSVAGVYITFINAEFAYDILGGFNFETVIAVMLPWMAWAFGLHGPFTFFVALMCSLVLFGTLISAAYLGYLVQYLSKGQTNFEFNKGYGAEFDTGYQSNIKMLLGKNWQYCWLFPWIPSHLYTDGTTFITKQFPTEELKTI